MCLKYCYKITCTSELLFSPLGKPADRAIYFACVNFFFFSFFLLWAKLSQYLLDRFSRSFYQIEGICVNFLDPVHFFRFLKGRCHGLKDVAMATNFVWYRTCSLRAKVSQNPLDRFSQSLHHMVDIEWQMMTSFYCFRYLKGRRHGNQFGGKSRAKLPMPLHLSLCQSKMEWDIATSMGTLTAQMIPLHRVSKKTTMM